MKKKKIEEQLFAPKQTFEQKVKSMTASQIIMAMVDGLQNPVVKINMITFGIAVKGVCYGCAATNTICKIADVVPTVKKISSAVKIIGIKPSPFKNDKAIYKALDASYKQASQFVHLFECAIDDLRLGSIQEYNFTAEKFGFATINRRRYNCFLK